VTEPGTPPCPDDAAELPAATSRAEADHRADWWEAADPFSDLPPSQLTAEHIANYARVAATIYPFDERWLKGATYEVGISGNVYYWDEKSQKHILAVEAQPGGEIVLQPNSITFVETDVEFRLPHYIAARFNLHIKLVHRGLLLGTGPIVDPGFRGKLLIPLHNLTSTSYTIEQSEKIVWVEFSKTLFGTRSSSVGYEVKPEDFRLFPSEKRWRTPAEYLQKANAGNPIVSSISGFFASTEERVRGVERRVSGLEVVGYISILIAVIFSLGTSWALYNNALDILKSYTAERDSLKSRVELLEACRKSPNLKRCQQR
jgi:deoxycytidine triphosphate deaminase